MALKRNERYPGRFNNPSTEYPQGAFKNRTAPTAQDGSYLEADWANDHDGFFARLLNVAGLTPNGTVDTGVSSQLYDALVLAMTGRLINVQILTSSGTYTKTAGTKRIRVRMVGGGGGGGGSVATNSSQISCAFGGNAGSYAESKIIDVSSINTVSCVVGSAGVGVTGSNGVNGGNSSFGSYLIAPGGTGGGAGPAGSGLSVGNDNLIGTQSSGSALLFGDAGRVGQGPLSIAADVLNQSSFKAGKGGDSIYGGGGGGKIGGGAVRPGTGYGAGGGGAAVGPSAPTGVAGGNGSPGIIIVEEFV